MVRLENNQQFRKAAERAAKNHNFVVRVSDGQYRVHSGVSSNDYLVSFFKGGDGKAWANCTCIAGQNNAACHHVVSAGWVHKGIVRMAKRAA
ncbi:MAG TPA: hypothetical protein VFD58_10800 [Blastocatellia bacterium]|nr:hypothetical protein [Blastocatellia bacterium]